VADWGGGMSASCKPRVQLFADAGNGWPHSALPYIISSCQSAATSEIVKRFWSRTLARSAITSIAAFTFYLLSLHRPITRTLQGEQTVERSDKISKFRKSLECIVSLYTHNLQTNIHS